MSSEAKHTPGPYTVQPADHLGDPAYAVVAADGDAIAVGCLYGDAVLFAAAPDLLEALRFMLGRFDFGEQFHDDHPIIVARAALAKARGAA